MSTGHDVAVSLNEVVQVRVIRLRNRIIVVDQKPPECDIGIVELFAGGTFEDVNTMHAESIYNDDS